MRNYVDEVVKRTCSGSGSDFETWISELRTLNDQANGKASTLVLAGLGLGGEAGEVEDIVKKLAFHGKPFDDETIAKLKKEAGDVCWYLGALFWALDTDFEEVMALNNAKLKARYPNGFNFKDSVNKADELLLPDTRS